MRGGGLSRHRYPRGFWFGRCGGQANFTSHSWIGLNLALHLYSSACDCDETCVHENRSSNKIYHSRSEHHHIVVRPTLLDMHVGAR